MNLLDSVVILRIMARRNPITLHLTPVVLKLRVEQ